ncbi:hypothetical protein HK096_001901, partial [Nowakowskiella sp. JEL0078]
MDFQMKSHEERETVNAIFKGESAQIPDSYSKELLNFLALYFCNSELKNLSNLILSNPTYSNQYRSDPEN